MERYLIVADDFTGATDTGVQLARHGLRLSVSFGPEIPAEGSVVIDTESRPLSPDAAGERVRASLERVRPEAFDCLFKKVDSTLRGNIGRETGVMDAMLRPELIIAAPAFPDMGRTTINGVQLLRGVPVNETEQARDPKNPVHEARIAALLGAEIRETVHVMDLATLRSGTASFEGGRIWCCDAEYNQDLLRVVELGRRHGGRILWVGTAGLADALTASITVALPVLGVCASLSSVSREQVRHAAEAGVALVSVPVADIMERRASAEDSVRAALGLLSRGRDCLIAVDAAVDADAYGRSGAAAAKLGMDSRAAGDYVQRIMADICRNILGGVAVGGLFLTGGDTAIGIFRAVGVQGAQILGEVATGIPLLRLAGGMADGLRAVTKAGAFGHDDAIAYAFRKLKEHN